MIVFDLICGEGAHIFEGWFSSSEDFEGQCAQGLVACPICGCGDIEKAMMAPNVGAKSNSQNSVPPPRSSGEQSDSMPAVHTAKLPAEYQELIGKMAEAQAKILANSEWVGIGFADQARDIYYGDAEERPIHGIASAKEASDLEEEGIEIAPLPLPVIPPKTQN